MEEEGSGVHHYEYRIDSTSGSWTSVGISTNFETPPQSSGVHTVYMRAVDNVGLVGDIGNVQFFIDLVAPTTPVPLLPDKGIHLDVGPTFSWSPADDSVSGVASYTLQIDSSASFDSVKLKEFSGITAANYTLGDPMSFGKWYWRVYAVDKAGNKGAFSDYFNLISDRIMINHGGVTDDRVDLGSSSIVWFTAIYEYDGITLDSSKGSLYVNDLEMTWNEENSRWEKSFSYTGVSKHNFRVYSVKDLTFGLTTLDDQVSVKSIIWDRVNIELTASDSRINMGDTANITWTGVYEFDRRSFTDSLLLNDTKTKTIVGEYGYRVKSISDSKYGLTVFQSNAVSVVFDRINIKISASDDRIDIGSEAPISWTGIYEYDETIFNGTATYNNTQTIFDSVGRRSYTISSVNDPRYNITVFRSNHEYIIWDRIKIIDGGVSSPSTYVNQAEIVWFQAAYEYDDVIFDSSSGTLYLNGSAMTWSVNNRWEHGFLFDDPDIKKFRVSSASDTRYNLKTLNDMVGIQSIAWYVPTTFTIFLTPSSSYYGFKVDIDGSLTYQNASGVQGAIIILSYSVDEGKTWIEIPHVTSDLSGAYSSVWIPPDPGNYRIRAVLESDIWIGREEQWNLYLTSFKDQYVFPILSNSTVSDLIYDPTTRELRFTVSGPSDTEGYSSVFIGSALAPGITDIKVYLDGEAQSFNSRSAGDSWLLRFPYSHSTSHFVKISLRSPTMLWTLLAVGLAACVFVVIVLEQRIKKQYTSD